MGGNLVLKAGEHDFYIGDRKEFRGDDAGVQVDDGNYNLFNNISGLRESLCYCQSSGVVINTFTQICKSRLGLLLGQLKRWEHIYHELEVQALSLICALS